MMMVPRKNGEFELFNEMLKNSFFSNEAKIMKTDIKEKENEYLIEIDLPGYDKENIKIDINRGYLTVRASVSKDNKETEEENFIHKERVYGECSRSFYIGDEVKDEMVKASFKNGILKLLIPKIKKEKKSSSQKYIKIED